MKRCAYGKVGGAIAGDSDRGSKSFRGLGSIRRGEWKLRVLSEKR